MKVLVLSFFLLFLTNCGYLESRSLKKSLDQKNCEAAKSLLLNSIKRDLGDETSKFNLVYAFWCADDIASALKQVDALLEQSSPYNFELYFLKGYLLGETGETDDALKAYQAALDIQNSVNIKQNMELLLKNAQPGKGGKKKGKGKKQKDSQNNKDAQGDEEDPNQQNKDPKSQDQNKKDPKESNSKKMTKKQIEKIMKEIDGDEKKIRSQGLKIKTKKGNSQNDKDW